MCVKFTIMIIRDNKQRHLTAVHHNHSFPFYPLTKNNLYYKKNIYYIYYSKFLTKKKLCKSGIQEI